MSPPPIRYRRTNKRAPWSLIALAMALAIPPGAWVWLQWHRTALPGRLDLHGTSISSEQSLRATLAQDAQRYAQGALLIEVGTELASASHSLLGAQVDVEGTVAAVHAMGRSGNPIRDLRFLWSTLVETVPLRPQLRTNHTQVEHAVRLLRTVIEQPPVPGAFNQDGQATPGKPGVTLNLPRAVRRIKDALLAGLPRVRLELIHIPSPSPIVASGRNRHPDLNVAMGRYQTQYSDGGPSAGRARNIELAARLVDGSVLEPGETFSFNGTVGARARSRGFAAAKELVNRRVVDGVGGGVCQVAATLHATAYLAGFDIPEYQPHSRPARYIPIGLDTMVAWGRRDLKIRNIYPFPVRISAHASEGELTVHLFGRGKAYAVTWTAEAVRTSPATTVREPDAMLEPGTERVVQRPVDGVQVRRVRTVFTGATSDTSTSILSYAPTPKVIAYGP